METKVGSKRWNLKYYSKMKDLINDTVIPQQSFPYDIVFLRPFKNVKHETMTEESHNVICTAKCRDFWFAASVENCLNIMSTWIPSTFIRVE